MTRYSLDAAQDRAEELAAVIEDIETRIAQTLTHGERERVRHVASTRELAAVIADIETRIGRDVQLGDLEEVVIITEEKSDMEKSNMEKSKHAVIEYNIALDGTVYATYLEAHHASVRIRDARKVAAAELAKREGGAA